MKYLVKIGELQEKCDSLEGHLELINNYIIDIESLKDKLVWEGEARDAFELKYNDYLKKLKEFERNIIDFIMFLKSFQGNYAEEYQRLKEEYANAYTEMVMLDVNDKI